MNQQAAKKVKQANLKRERHFQRDLAPYDFYQQSQSAAYIIQSAIKTDKGLTRQKNEDFVSGLVFSLNNPEQNQTLGLYLLCDGMGGFHGGEVASKIAVQSIIQFLVPQFQDCPVYLTPENVGMIFDMAAKYAANAITKHSEKDSIYQNMGTTLLMVLAEGSRFYFAHLGDSRLYKISGQQICQITRDHTLANAVNNQNIPKNILTRALSTENIADLDLNLQISPLELKDQELLLLCSDGLHSQLSDSEILYIIKSCPHLLDAAKNLINAANEKGGIDNISVILLRVLEAKPF